MKEALVPIWILGAPFIGLLVLAFSFKGPSSMSNRSAHRADEAAYGGRAGSN